MGCSRVLLGPLLIAYELLWLQVFLSLMTELGPVTFQEKLDLYPGNHRALEIQGGPWAQGVDDGPFKTPGTVVLNQANKNSHEPCLMPPGILSRPPRRIPETPCGPLRPPS